MEYYSFRTPQLADRFADLLEGRYRYEIFAIYGQMCIRDRPERAQPGAPSAASRASGTCPPSCQSR